MLEEQDKKKWGPMIITTGGRNVMAKTVAGKQLKFTRAIAGEGYPAEDDDVSDLTELVSPVKDMEILEIEGPDLVGDGTGTTGQAIITIELTNKDFPRGFYLSEIGLFARDPDTGAEVLYGYCCVKEEKKSQFMPGFGGAEPVTFEFGLTVVVDQTKDITALFAANPSHVSRSALSRNMDEIRREMIADDARLQRQIDLLAEASILQSLDYAEWRLARLSAGVSGVLSPDASTGE